MKVIKTHGTFNEAIANSSPVIQELAQGLRDLIEDIYPDATEVPWPKQGIIGYGLGPKKMSEHFCYIGLYREHVNLGFYHGVSLPDPDGRLEGTGKKLRHAKIHSLQDIELSPLRELIQRSIAEREKSLGRQG